MPQSDCGSNISEGEKNVSLTLWGSHDYQWTNEESNFAYTRLSSDINLSIDSPLDHVVIVAGDVNRPCE